MVYAVLLSGGTYDMKDIFKKAEDLVKLLSPQQLADLRKVYSEQKRNNKGLDKAVKNLTEEIQDGFKHSETPK